MQANLLSFSVYHKKNEINTPFIRSCPIRRELLHINTPFIRSFQQLPAYGSSKSIQLINILISNEERKQSAAFFQVKNRSITNLLKFSKGFSKKQFEHPLRAMVRSPLIRKGTHRGPMLSLL